MNTRRRIAFHFKTVSVKLPFSGGGGLSQPRFACDQSDALTKFSTRVGFHGVAKVKVARAETRGERGLESTS